FFFFFSSRRRHTRCLSDWSSDVCSSDLEQPDGPKAPLELVLCGRCGLLQLKHTISAEAMYKNYWYRSGTNQTMRNALADIANKEIGRASCRERVKIEEVSGEL